ncbi:hypothetical protein LMG28688_06063 [Paraburkholderia caffeinitolerans]|uniref:DUF2252 domain-containing protein n=1 Tax=Paraburkholderia caffeinitolerans TaxID=1723730 RepID=A0A6J5GW25_9BURK|nr:hypothetical protein LMG28688_06063 [Paraburkholderia caffeinitolerans]
MPVIREQVSDVAKHRIGAPALARAHARSGDAAMMAGYMGSGQTFDDAIGEFAMEYRSQNRLDYRAFIQAIREGKIQDSGHERRLDGLSAC